MKNVIEFPKNKSKKARSAKRTESRQAVIALSVVTLIMGFVLINDSMTKNERTTYLISDNNSQLNDLNRAIASAKPMNPFRDIEWERDLAKKLGQEGLANERIPSSVGSKMTVLEELQIATLKWKYSILNQPVGHEVLIKEINYVQSQDVDDQPEFIVPEQFLAAYQKHWVVSFSKVQPEPHREIMSESKSPTDLSKHKAFKLLDDSNKVVGEAVFTFDHEERFLSLKIKPISVP